MKSLHTGYAQLFVALLLFGAGLFASTVHAEDYSNNIGFMKNPPKELKEKFPMCDQFLDVNWIKQFPHGWVGVVVTDVYTFEKKDQRELVFFIDLPNSVRNIINIYEISVLGYQGAEFDKLIISATRAYGGAQLSIVSNGKETIITKEQGYMDQSLKNGSPKRSFTHFTQNICVTRPRGEGGWVIEKNMPFLIESRMSRVEIKKFEQLKDLAAKECMKVINETGWSNKDFTCEPLASGAAKIRPNITLDDADGDGLKDYYIWSLILFLNDRQPFIMPFPKTCRKERASRNYYEPYGKQQEERCVADNKKKYLQNKNAIK